MRQWPRPVDAGRGRGGRRQPYLRRLRRLLFGLGSRRVMPGHARRRLGRAGRCRRCGRGLAGPCRGIPQVACPPHERIDVLNHLLQRNGREAAIRQRSVDNDHAAVRLNAEVSGRVVVVGFQQCPKMRGEVDIRTGRQGLAAGRHPDKFLTPAQAETVIELPRVTIHGHVEKRAGFRLGFGELVGQVRQPGSDHVVGEDTGRRGRRRGVGQQTGRPARRCKRDDGHAQGNSEQLFPGTGTEEALHGELHIVAQGSAGAMQSPETAGQSHRLRPEINGLSELNQIVPSGANVAD